MQAVSVRRAAGAALMALVLSVVFVWAAVAAQGEIVECYVHGRTPASLDHGERGRDPQTDPREFVILHPYEERWIGDHFAYLSITTRENFDGTGALETVEFDLPQPGIRYYGPGRLIVEWTVCKGETPETTTTTTVPEDSTTTVPEDTTTTVPEDTTTTVPETTTTTEPDPEVTTTTTTPLVTTTTVGPTGTTAPPEVQATTTVPSTLPYTGVESEHLAIVAFAALAAGAGLLMATRKNAEASEII